MRFPWQKVEKKDNPGLRSILVLQGGRPVYSPTRYDQLAKEGYLRCAIAYACVKAITGSMAAVPWLGQELPRSKDGKVVDLPEDHDLMRLIRRPNPEMGHSKFIRTAESFKLISGDSYIYRNGPTGTMELWPLRPDLVKIIPGSNPAQRVAGYRYPDGFPDPQTYKPEEVLHLNEFHPLDDWYGLSPMFVAAASIDILNLGAKWNAKLLENDARPAGIIKTSGNLTDEQFERIKNLIKEKISGVDNAGLPQGPFEGGLEWQSLSYSPKDMDWDRLLRRVTRDVCAVFNVSPEIIGDSENKTYSNYQEARKALYLENILPRLDDLRDELNYWLVPLFGDRLRLDYDRDSIDAIREDRSKLITDMCAMVDRGIIDRDQAATQLGFEERGGASAIPTVSGTVMPLDAALGDPGTVTAEDTEKVDENGKDEVDKGKEGEKDKEDEKDKEKVA
jgi:HK97 family phage portal protein